MTAGRRESEPLLPDQAPAHAVLHVTESMSGGVLEVLVRLAVQQAGEGRPVRILYARRPETPSKEVLQQRFADVELEELPSANRSRARILREMYRRIALHASGGHVTTVHLHSSYAGLIGRLLPQRHRGGALVLYSPHGFAFLRTDKPWLFRRLLWTAERFLSARGDGVLAVSKGEAAVARQAVGRKSQVDLLENRLDLASLPMPAAKPTDRKPLVVNLGRVAPQKGFDRFQRAAAQFKEDAHFLWIGGDAAENLMIESESLETTGWIPHDEALEHLRSADVFLFTSRWEGMPIALMEAQAMGVPAVAWECTGVSDIVDHERSGFVVRNDAEMANALSLLIFDPDLRSSMASAARNARGRFDSAGYGLDSLKLYESLRRRGARKPHDSEALAHGG